MLHQELKKLINLQRLKTFAIEKVTSVSMEFREVTDEMDMISQKFPDYLIKSFSKRVSKLYLNFGMIKSITFFCSWHLNTQSGSVTSFKINYHKELNLIRIIMKILYALLY